MSLGASARCPARFRRRTAKSPTFKSTRKTARERERRAGAQVHPLRDDQTAPSNRLECRWGHRHAVRHASEDEQRSHQHSSQPEKRHESGNGVQVHKFIPFVTIKRRLQIGLNVAGGIGTLSGTLQKTNSEVTNIQVNQKNGTRAGTACRCTSSSPS